MGSDELLKCGIHGEEVRRPQADLTSAGYAPGPADGVLGERTDAAVRAFQAAEGLVVDRFVGA